jgi:PAS domain S-box-containing protein
MILPFAAVAFAIAIFVVDTFTPLGIAVAALYVVVILMAGRFLQRKGVLVVAAACVVLTVLSYIIQHWDTYGPSLVRAIVSLVAIVITTFLALKSQDAAVKLREQASLLEITHDAVIVRDLNDAISFWNRGAEELYGWSSEEALAKISHDLLQTEFPEPLDEIKKKLGRDGRWEGELGHRTRDGTKLTVASRWSVQRDARGRPIATLETSNDITERKRAQTELAHVTRVTTLGELTASIAHEVNQPLAAIIINGEASLRWLGMNPPNLIEARGAVDRMVRDCHRASEVIKRLRGLVKKSEPQTLALSVNDVINDVVMLVQGELMNHRVHLRLELDGALGPVSGDRVQLQQVLINLIMNGIEAMTAVGPDRRDLRIRSQNHEDGQVLVTVDDSGLGIDPEQVDRLFEAFVTTKNDGMGMGLSICRSIVETHGGILWAEPRDGAGASFRFTLPLRRVSGT